MKFCSACETRLRRTKDGRTVCPNCGDREESKGATLAGSFPYRSMRPFQKEVLDRIGESLTSRKFIIVEAPVGFGKSALAASLCNFLSSGFVLTSTKQLQDQYSSDFGFPVVFGKSNFTCCVPTSSGVRLPCSKGRCEVDWNLSDCPHYLTFEQYDEHERGRCTRGSKCEHLKEDRLCPYYDQKWSAFRAPVTVCNYPFFFSELRYTDDIPHRKLLVCDEAHDLEKQLVSFASFTLKGSTVRQFDSDASEDAGFVIPDKGLEDAGEWLGVIGEAGKVLGEYCRSHAHDEHLQDRVAVCTGALKSLEGFAEDLRKNGSNWVVNAVKSDRDGRVEEVDFQPIDVSGFTSRLFATADLVLFMSATIFSKAMLCRTLGISEADAEFVQVRESSFPVENRPIYAMNAARLNRASMEASLEAIARAADEIMSRHSTEKGVIHTTSYQQVNYIMEHVSEPNKRRLVTTQGSFEKSTLLRIHGSTNASVLISPSLYQGVDLKNELSRFQVIVKVPYPDLSERRTQVKLRRDGTWYDWQTALRLVQTYGRSVRGADDHAVTYVLDANFEGFLDAHRDLFPAYFLQAVTVEGGMRAETG